MQNVPKKCDAKVAIVKTSPFENQPKHISLSFEGAKKTKQNVQAKRKKRARCQKMKIKRKEGKLRAA